MLDKEHYTTIANELETDTVDRALWTHAIAEASGNPEASKALYIKLRLAELKKAEMAAKGFSLQLVMDPIHSSAGSASAEPDIILRATLKKELLAGKRSSLYQILDVPADASDQEIMDAISELEASPANDELTLSTEFKLAKETLQNRQARDDYDRKLLASLQPATMDIRQQPAEKSYPEQTSLILHLWESRKGSVILGVLCVLILGALLLGFIREHDRLQIQKAQIAAVEAAIQAARNNEAARIENERVARETELEIAERSAKKSAEYGDIQMDIRKREEDRRRQEMENDAYQSSKRLAMQRDEQKRREEADRQRRDLAQRYRDDQIARSEQKYWTCMNVELSRTSEAQAGSRCSHYRN